MEAQKVRVNVECQWSHFLFENACPRLVDSVHGYKEKLFVHSGIFTEDPTATLMSV